MCEIGIILDGINLTKEIAGYLGLIETLDIKMDKLCKSELDAAIRSLEQANRSKSEKTSLLREARNRFNKAISIESNERLISAYIGLAICHSHLGDKENFIEALSAIDSVKFKGEAKYIAGLVVENSIGGGLWKVALGKNPLQSLSLELLEARKSKINDIKKGIKAYLSEIK